MIKSIIFDFDGVIANSMDQILQVSNHALKRLGHNCIAREEDVRSLESMEYESLGRNLGLSQEEASTFTQCVYLSYDEVETSQKLVPGIAQVIHELAEKFSLSIVSGNSTEMIQVFLKNNDLLQYFEFVLGENDSKCKKIKLQMALTQHKIKAIEAVMIGDAVSDALAARQVGITIFGATWGNQHLDMLEASNPDALCFKPTDIIRFLEKG